jgi:hypothetical protein
LACGEKSSDTQRRFDALASDPAIRFEPRGTTDSWLDLFDCDDPNMDSMRPYLRKVVLVDDPNAAATELATNAADAGWRIRPIREGSQFTMSRELDGEATSVRVVIVSDRLELSSFLGAERC